MKKISPFRTWAENRDTVLESGYARVRRIMFGDVPSIRTIGIITAQNPQGEQLNAAENRKRNYSLEEYLRTSNFGPIKVKGKYNSIPEDSFLVPNVGREELVIIGRRFNQEAVIWGEKGIDQYNHPYFRFEYIDTKSGQTQSVRSVHLGDQDVQGRNDYYTMIGGRKFVIPFFDDPHSRKVPGKKYGTVADVPDIAATSWTDDELADKVRKAETFAIPFFDNPTVELVFLSFDGQVNEMTYYSDRLPDTPQVRKLVEDIQTHTEASFEEGRIGKFYWHHRGIVRECLWKLNRL